MTNRISFLLISLLVPSLHAWKYETLYFVQAPRLAGEKGRTDTAWYFDTVATGGRYARTSVPVHEGGWSGLELDNTDPTGSSFWSIQEGGLATSRETAVRNDRIVAFPNHHQKLVRLKLVGETVQFDRVDSIASWGNPANFTVGLQNTIASSDATQLRMDLATGAIDTTAKIPASADGYDFEAIRFHGGTFWLSDESGPYIAKVNASTRRIDKQWSPDNGLPKVFARRRANRGFEAMAVTPSGSVVATTQSPLYNAQGDVANSSTRDSRVQRLLVLDPATGAVREHVYLNDQKPNALGPTRKGRDCKIGDMVAIDDTRFLVVEHGEGAGGKYWIDLWAVDISKATNVTSTAKTGATYSNGKLTLEQLQDSATLAANNVVPATKTPVRSDIMGTTPWRSVQPEGLAIVDDTTVALLSDDNFGCREMQSDGGPDGICHIQAAEASRSTLMYLKVPPLGWKRLDARRTGRAGLRIGSERGAVVVSWPAGRGSLKVELLDLAGRSLYRWDVATAGAAGRRAFPAPERSAAFLVRVRDASASHSAVVAQP